MKKQFEAELNYLVENFSCLPYGYPNIGEWFKKRILANLETRYILSVRQETVVVGLIIIDIKEGKICHLSVDSFYRRIGMGTFLYKSALQNFKDCGIKTIFTQGCLYALNSFVPFTKIFASRTLTSNNIWKVIGLSESYYGRDLVGKDILIQLEL